jgi:hypothetical protein
LRLYRSRDTVVGVLIRQQFFAFTTTPGSPGAEA